MDVVEISDGRISFRASLKARVNALSSPVEPILSIVSTTARPRPGRGGQLLFAERYTESTHAGAPLQKAGALTPAQAVGPK